MSSSLEALLKLRPYGIASSEALKSADWLSFRSKRLGSLAESIGRLTNLTFLNLSDNELSSLPESIRQLTNLTYLSLEANQLSSFPESIGQLTNLTGLSLDFLHCLNPLDS
eukprot:TRINITY_DN2426_c0_g1_i1.p1 TRINITY_DN2426_c0_g1~~TRINITY_DN2426_c0_g1_i1.p1  ORF type:complete len:111 (+),score=12.56 TRINITY_DN2426_c0_g1_i1:48-380(+)